ncbi:cell wall-binding repeat-containing protein [Herbiconiux moechotypicola]|uniref:Cell wall-binding repeat-containing protein n=1 Tax=Herbiconiux moechotypicola TaxID=637393 RepID=A0ABP5QIB2_9MICO|nr:cell wall-binding repeat-containing protein [Herbiconiux moechotypicola]MCS5730009.1 cell wall-binding repeat-containing protein [Herbiconiux moechotypicola]
MIQKRSRARSCAALAGGLTAALALSALAAAPASAATVPAAAAAEGSSITGAVFTWSLTDEANAKAFAPGTVNMLSAGKVAKTSASDSITEADWMATDGDVTIQKEQADGSYATGTWAGLLTTPDGSPLSGTKVGTPSGNRVSIAAGSGTVDPDNESADITWTGDFTVALYSGLTQYSVSDPHLVVEDGEGTVTATLSGYGTEMDDPEAFVVLPDTEVTLATLSGVDVTATGFTVDPEYLGVSVDLPAGATAQVTSGDTWGSFPQSFVDYQLLTGQSSYWYSSGGQTDAAKVAEPIGVSYTVATTPTVTVSKTEGLNPDGETITITGTGFLPSPPATTGVYPPLAGQFTGAYVTFGSFLDTWKPSDGAPGSARATDRSATKWAVLAEQLPVIDPSGSGAGIELSADGSFSTTITVSKNFAGSLADGNYGIYTYAAGGAVYAPFETYTPIEFTTNVDRLAGADRVAGAVAVSQEAYPEGTDVAYVVSGYTFADALSAAPAAVSESAPLLLTTPDSLPASVGDEIERLGASTIVIVGGPNSVSTAVQSSLEDLADNVTRVTGADRYATSLAVADYAFGEEGATSAYVATGANFPDALSASAAGGAYGRPVVLVAGSENTVNKATSSLLSDLGVEEVLIAGGPNSVSTGIQTSLGTVSGVTAVERLAGADRFAASIAINNDAFDRAAEVYLATGLNYPDALAGAALAGLRGAPLYVVPGDCVPTGVLSAIDTLGAGTVTLLGGPNSLSAAVESLTACSF